MDSITQFALGACVARAAAPAVRDPRLLVWGGVLATLPDLDSLLIRGDALTLISQHRSWSHSVIMMALATPLFAALAGRLQAFSSLSFRRRCLLVYAVFLTHTLLDALTVYGTQLLWPVDRTPFAAAIIFIIDPLYTLPLAAGALLSVRRRSQADGGMGAVRKALALSSAYLLAALAAKMHVGDLAEQWRQRHASQPDRAAVLTVPMPFNILLWRVVIVEPGAYHEGLVGLLDDARPPPRRFRRDGGEGLGLQARASLARVREFTGPFYRVVDDEGTVLVEDLRMGLDPDYFFRFLIQRADGRVPDAVSAPRGRSSLYRLPAMWRRIWDDQSPPP